MLHPAAATSDASRATFEREGWVLVPQLLDAATVATLQGATQRLEHAAAGLMRDTLVKGVFYEMQTRSGRKGDPAVHAGALRKITSPSKGQPAFARLRVDDRVLRGVENCGLSAPRCLIDQVNFKLPQVGTCFPYHQDERFLIGEALQRVQRWGGVNLVIALDTSDPSNGGFEVLGRTHLGGITDDPYDASSMNSGVFDETYRTLPTLLPGDALLFHPRLAHGSGPNLSPASRRLVTLWYGGGERAAAGLGNPILA